VKKAQGPEASELTDYRIPTSANAPDLGAGIARRVGGVDVFAQETTSNWTFPSYAPNEPNI